MPPIGISLETTQFIPEAIRIIMISSVVASVAGLALAFFSSNPLATVGFSLLGVCSVIGFCLVEEAEELNQLAQLQAQGLETIQQVKGIANDFKINTSTLGKTNHLFRHFAQKTPSLTKELNKAVTNLGNAAKKPLSSDQNSRLTASLKRAKEKRRLASAAN